MKETNSQVRAPHELGVSDEIAISVSKLSKKYQLYDSPTHRLKEALHPFRKKYHHDFWALKDISFEVKRGECLGIIGKNGSGKSTLLQILCGVLQKTTGDIVVNGRVSALLELGAGFDPDLTGRENVYMNGAIMGFTREEMNDKYQAIADFADIGEFIEQPVKTYSSGMYVRLAFAAAINVDPDILIIDEALSVGDVFFKQKCFKRLNEFLERKIPIILVSHSMADITQYCQRVMLLDKGCLKYEGNANEVVSRYFLMEQKERLVAKNPSRPDFISNLRRTHLDNSCLSDGNQFWPQPQAFLDISKVSQITDGWARCTGVALCNASGESCRVFKQGETASFFYEFELLKNIEVPIGGLTIISEKNILAHGKSTLEYGTDVPRQVIKGSFLRFRQDIALELQIGEFTFSVGLAMMTRDYYEQRSSLPPDELRVGILRLCHLPKTGQLTVMWRQHGHPVKLLHHGLCNLPGKAVCYVSSVKTRKDGASACAESRSTAVNYPTIFHVTHWKAGSQWIHKILREAVPDLVVKPQLYVAHFCDSPILSGKVYPTVYVTKEQFDSVNLPEKWLRFVIIRDLRDTLISAYFSIKVSHPMISPEIEKNRLLLNKLNVEEGLIYLLDNWLPYCASIQASWIAAQEKMIRYEDLLENDIDILENLLIDECQLPLNRKHLSEIVIANRFVNLTKGRIRGEEDITAHERKGISGDWKVYFTDAVKHEFKIRYGRLLINTGYETDMNW